MHRTTPVVLAAASALLAGPAPKTLADINAKWAANEDQGNNWVHMVYNSFKRP
jgi:hypothetical protein